MNAVDHFRDYLTKASDAQLEELRTLTVSGPPGYNFYANVFTLKLRGMVYNEQTDRFFRRPQAA